ncbi:MAG: hypothetical protein ACK5Z2_10660 [Bacteroidota bacterium]|jgi:hypothetical protein
MELKFNSNAFAFILPEEVSIKDLLELYAGVLQKKESDWILIFWDQCKVFPSECVCLLRCMFQNDTFRTASHTNFENSVVYPYFKNILDYNIEEIESVIEKRDFFLSSAKDEETINSRKKQMLDYLLSHNTLKGFDLTGIEQIFGELYMNICQHSGDENGLVYIPDFTGEEYLTIIFVDLGRGIAKNIKDYFPEYIEKSDIDAIEFATNDWITTKSTPQNYGRGLAHLLTISDALQGEVIIISGQGKLIRSNNENQKQLFDEYFPGTLISAKLNLRNFEKQELQFFNEDIDF